MGLVDRARGGDIRAVARLASHLENRDEIGRAALEMLYPTTGSADTIGVTGPPGAGKSSLVSRLIAEFRGRRLRVGVIAVDPSSPLSGGAALGDRIRMLDHYNDPDVFVRSMASRGLRGGLAPATSALIHLLDAARFDVILVETVGIGQEEIAISRLVQTTALVQVPGLGDSVQALKAGVIEVADVYIVNKCELPGADDVARELRGVLALGGRRGPDAWTPRVVKVSAETGAGIDDLAKELDRRRTFLAAGDARSARRREIARREVEMQIEALIAERVAPVPADRPGRADLIAEVAERRQSALRAAERLLVDWR